ncbi:hypothetical protein PCANC_02154 [Puccinia coronata f. sp. avenae]|uniref:Uncharacterized protein n=1 Tax=Puccinia coronata f. sp. avenae TaxID=200324 RepID=A0A2N5VZV9_9BASI|nr:hypothetical protein PCANC_02154 [Puccinia coronata f. sp. avenae]
MHPAQLANLNASYYLLQADTLRSTRTEFGPKNGTNQSLWSEQAGSISQPDQTSWSQPDIGTGLIHLDGLGQVTPSRH